MPGLIFSPLLFTIIAIKGRQLPIYPPWRINGLVGQLVPFVRYEVWTTQSTVMWDRTLNVLSHGAQANLATIRWQFSVFFFFLEGYSWCDQLGDAYRRRGTSTEERRFSALQSPYRIRHESQSLYDWNTTPELAQRTLVTSPFHHASQVSLTQFRLLPSSRCIFYHVLVLRAIIRFDIICRH